MFVSGAKRKLVPQAILIEVHDLHVIGVPLAKILRDKDLDACRPVISKLLDAYDLAQREDMTTKVRHKVFNSLFPVWLAKEPTIQEQPDGWRYAGRFPTGQWLAPNVATLEEELENENN